VSIENWTQCGNQFWECFINDKFWSVLAKSDKKDGETEGKIIRLDEKRRMA